MCLGVPGQVIEVADAGPLRMAIVDFGGARRRVSLAYVPEAQPGDYCVVHVGFAISVMDEDEAMRRRALLGELIVQEIGPGRGLP
jgi:hydrogenase expression/formation protein HypC